MNTSPVPLLFALLGIGLVVAGGVFDAQRADVADAGTDGTVRYVWAGSTRLSSSAVYVTLQNDERPVVRITCGGTLHYRHAGSWYMVQTDARPCAPVGICGEGEHVILGDGGTQICWRDAPSIPCDAGCWTAVPLEAAP